MKKNEFKKIMNDFSYWMELIPTFWKISGNYEKLNSEFDLNIKVSDQKDKKFIIKIMRYPCDKVFLEGQIDFLKFIEKSDTFFPIPKIYKSIKAMTLKYSKTKRKRKICMDC